MLLRRYLVQDHPRVCGKDFVSFLKTYPQPGSPPRVREGPYISNFLSFHFRITPACAGRTIKASRCQLYHQDHPRVCGKDRLDGFKAVNEMGSPPHMREGRIIYPQIFEINRITPACAGRTRKIIEEKSYWRDHPRVCGKDHHFPQLSR